MMDALQFICLGCQVCVVERDATLGGLASAFPHEVAAF